MPGTILGATDREANKTDQYIASIRFLFLWERSIISNISKIEICILGSCFSVMRTHTSGQGIRERQEAGLC